MLMTLKMPSTCNYTGKQAGRRGRTALLLHSLAVSEAVVERTFSFQKGLGHAVAVLTEPGHDPVVAICKSKLLARFWRRQIHSREPRELTRNNFLRDSDEL